MLPGRRKTSPSTSVGKPGGLLTESDGSSAVSQALDVLASQYALEEETSLPESESMSSSPAVAAAPRAPSTHVTNPETTEGFEQAVIRGPLGWRIQFREVHLEAKWRR